MDKPDSVLRIADVIEITKLSKSQIYNMISLERFPKQRRVPGAKIAYWSRNEVESWVQHVLN